MKFKLLYHIKAVAKLLLLETKRKEKRDGVILAVTFFAVSSRFRSRRAEES